MATTRKRLTRLSFLLSLATLLLWRVQPSNAEAGDAVVAYHLGLAAIAEGDAKKAYRLFKDSCMAEDGVADACMEWGALADKQKNEKDAMRAYGSAVMLAPDDIRGRFALAVKLIKKNDYVWAKEHLTAAIEQAKYTEDLSLLNYYLGYLLLKEGKPKEATERLSLAREGLPENLRQRCDFYLAAAAWKEGRRRDAALAIALAASGPDPKWRGAALARMRSQSAFFRQLGLAGQARASMGVNTHPASAFVDDPETESAPVLQSSFRADLLYGASDELVGFQALLTAYREQNWLELKKKEKDDEHAAGQTDRREFLPKDFNATVFMIQLAYIDLTWFGSAENEIRLGIDGDVQLLDHPPERTADGEYRRAKDPFQVATWAIGPKLWWSFSTDRDTVYGARFKIEMKPNDIDEDRSSLRTSLHLVNTRHLVDRTLRFVFSVGGQYDRTYNDPKVIKYDRLLPEAEVESRWLTPAPRLTATLSARLSYGWYLNSRSNRENSFRPGFIDDPGASEQLNLEMEKKYYDMTRKDFEWAANAELAVDLWRRSAAALVYTHQQRISNIDGADVPVDSLGEEIFAPKFGYTKDVVVLELRQSF